MLVAKMRPDESTINIYVFENMSLLLNNYFTCPDIEVWNFRGRTQ
jgi:hypothetical protein